MADAPEDFHRGLAAVLFDALNSEDAPEVGYYRDVIERSGQPALDAGCGPGRLLRCYLRAGLDVDGSDISPDMLELCRRHAAAEGLSPNLYCQSTARLDLPRRYRTIVSCGVYGLGGTRRDDIETLERFHHHLEPGGTLALDVEAGWAMPEFWNACTQSAQATTEWLDRGVTTLPDGDEIAVDRKLVEVDPLAQQFTLDLRYRRVRDGEDAEREVHRLIERWYGVHELTAMLEAAGFADVRVEGDYAPVPVAAGHRMHVFVARRA
jgi:SAM-dependent methyltransferase